MGTSVLFTTQYWNLFVLDNICYLVIAYGISLSFIDTGADQLSNLTGESRKGGFIHTIFSEMSKAAFSHNNCSK